jgi:hypothetical protein
MQGLLTVRHTMHICLPARALHIRLKPSLHRTDQQPATLPSTAFLHDIVCSYSFSCLTSV